MREIAGPGAVDGEFNDYDPVTNPGASVITADWGNDVQAEIIGVIEDAGLSQAPGSLKYLTKAIEKFAKENSKCVGELFYLDHVKTSNAYDVAEDVEEYFPAICLSAIAGTQVISATNWPLLVPHLRTKMLAYQSGKGSEVDNWSVTVSGSDITFPDIASANAMLASLLEDQLFHGGYTNWRTVNIDGTDYEITGINIGTRVVTVTGSPTTGSQTARFYENRIAGSTTTARLFAASGVSLVSPNDSNDELVPGLRVRNRFQGHTFYVHGNGSSGATGTAENIAEAVSDNDGVTWTATEGLTSVQTDGTNGTPRTGPTTRPDQMAGHLYIWGKKVQ